MSRSRLRARAGALVLAIAAALPGAAAAQTAPRDHSGVWWNAGESGWGVFTVDFGNTIAPTWYTYDEDGEAVWFIVAGAVPQADGSYVGDVYRFTGVPFAQIAGNAADPGTKLGTASFRFTGEDQLAMTYTIGAVTQAKQLTRFDFGQQDVVCHSGNGGSRATATNYSDLWWNPAQNGWGMTFTHVGDNLYVTWYTYGEDREAIWFLAQTSRQADGSFRGPLYRGTTGTPFLQINGAPPSEGPAEVGEATLAFSDGQTASFTYTAGNVTQTQPVQRFVAGNNPPVCETVTAPPPDARVLCLPQLQAGDEWEERVSLKLVNGNFSEVSNSTRTVMAAAAFQNQQALPIDVEVRQPNSTTVASRQKEYIVEGADARAQIGVEIFNAAGTKQATYVYQPAVQLPRKLLQNETVTRTYQITGGTGTVNVTESWKLIGTGSVSTAAGTFQDACKVQSTYNGVETAGTTVKTLKRTAIEYWHPTFGRVRSDYNETQTTKVGDGTPTGTIGSYRYDIKEAEIGGSSTH